MLINFCIKLRTFMKFILYRSQVRWRIVLVFQFIWQQKFTYTAFNNADNNNIYIFKIMCFIFILCGMMKRSFIRWTALPKAVIKTLTKCSGECGKRNGFIVSIMHKFHPVTVAASLLLFDTTFYFDFVTESGYVKEPWMLFRLKKA